MSPVGDLDKAIRNNVEHAIAAKALEIVKEHADKAAAEVRSKVMLMACDVAANIQRRMEMTTAFDGYTLKVEVRVNFGGEKGGAR